MNTKYNYDKFREWLLLKKYSPSTIQTIVKITAYFSVWAESEGITELSEISYSEAMGFIQWSSKKGTSQKTIANNLIHIRKFYQFLISEGEAKENPVAHIKVQGIKRKVYYDILNVEELQTLYRQYLPSLPPSVLPPPLSEGAGGRLSRQRNKVILGLLIYQGLRIEEVAALNLQDLQLREGKITIHSKNRAAPRTMKLESHQVFELMDYINEIRKQFLEANGVTDKLFLQRRNGENFGSITQLMLTHLRKINSRIKNLEQIRASVITAWLRQYDLRKVQYLAGHKYVSTTEKYKANVIDELQDDVTKYHPL